VNIWISSQTIKIVLWYSFTKWFKIRYPPKIAKISITQKDCQNCWQTWTIDFHWQTPTNNPKQFKTTFVGVVLWSGKKTIPHHHTAIFVRMKMTIIFLLCKNWRHGRGNRRSISATCEWCSMRRIMSGRGCVDFFVIFRKQFHRTHTQPHLLKQASPVKNNRKELN
jgi:hypothetical protein